MDTTAPEDVADELRRLLRQYHNKKRKKLDDILDFHQRFECIHPFQDGNERVGRLVMFKECLANGIIPFIITDELKMYYYRGLQQWPDIPGYLRDTCLTAQDYYALLMQKFRVGQERKSPSSCAKPYIFRARACIPEKQMASAPHFSH